MVPRLGHHVDGTGRVVGTVGEPTVGGVVNVEPRLGHHGSGARRVDGVRQTR